MESLTSSVGSATSMFSPHLAIPFVEFVTCEVITHILHSVPNCIMVDENNAFITSLHLISPIDIIVFTPHGQIKQTYVYHYENNKVGWTLLIPLSNRLFKAAFSRGNRSFSYFSWK